MNYKSIDIKSCYETGIDDVIEDFGSSQILVQRLIIGCKKCIL